uniref:Putative secreted protein n=1 Tax=Anopheles marajoara TaxID=58244 RepID=A0A2M4CA11_9DIPT
MSHLFFRSRNLLLLLPPYRGKTNYLKNCITSHPDHPTSRHRQKGHSMGSGSNGVSQCQEPAKGHVRSQSDRVILLLMAQLVNGPALPWS